MALEIATGNFAFPTSTGLNSVVTSLSFQPKAVLFWSAGTLASPGVEDHARMFMGASDGTNHYSAQMFSEHGQGTSDTGRDWQDDHCIYMTWRGGGGSNYSATTCAFLSNGFQINVDDAPLSGFLVFYLAIGGGDLVSAKVGQCQVPTDALPATLDVTDVGFSPDGLIFFNCWSNSAAGTEKTHGNFNIGLTDMTDNFYIAGSAEDGQGTSDVGQSCGDDGTLIRMSDGGIVVGRASVTSRLAEGFEVTILDQFPYAPIMPFLALHGFRMKTDDLVLPTTAVDIDKSTACGFTPQALLLMGNNETAYSESQLDSILEIGATDGTNENCSVTTDQDGVGTTDTASRINTSKLYQPVDFNSQSEGTVVHKSWDTNGFTLTRDLVENGPKADLLPWMAFGPGTGIEFVNQTDGYAAGASTTIAASAANHTAGNLLVVCIVGWEGGASGSVSSISDTAGNTYVSTGQASPKISDNGYSEIWYAKNISGNASNVVTVTYAESTTYREVSVHQYSGADTSDPYDVGNTGSGSSTTSFSTSAATTTSDNQIMVACYAMYNSGTITQGVSFLDRYDGNYFGSEEKYLFDAGSYSSDMTYSASTSFTGCHATFKAAAGAVATVHPWFYNRRHHA